MLEEEQFDNIVRANFGGNAPVIECETEDEQHDWLGFSHAWLEAFGLPEEPSHNAWSHEEVVASRLHESLPTITDWLIATGVADELADYWDFDEFLPALAEILMLRIADSHWDGLYCGGNVAQDSIALMDWCRVAIAFITAYEGRCVR
jgi:hypothetical protein